MFIVQATVITIVNYNHDRFIVQDIGHMRVRHIQPSLTFAVKAKSLLLEGSNHSGK
jgi:hypothetical protein